MVEGMSVVVNVTLYLMSSSPSLCNLGGEDMYFGCVCFRGELCYLKCDDICMCVVNKRFEFLEFVFNSVYVDLQYDDLSLILAAGCGCLCGVCGCPWSVCKFVFVLYINYKCGGCGYCHACTVIYVACVYAERGRECKGDGNAGMGDGGGMVVVSA